MKTQVVLASTVVCLFLWVSPAFAFFETNDQPLAQEWDSRYNASMSCTVCHNPNPMGTSSGPHGGYFSGSRACGTCHGVHDAIGTLKLLPGDTVKDTCGVCHDGTGGRGVYGTLAARGVSVGADHSLESTNVVPGGNAGTGGSSVMAFRGT